MAYPYDHRMQPRSRAQAERPVPLHVVRPIVEERDRLRVELERVRSSNARLSEALESIRAEQARQKARKAEDAASVTHVTNQGAEVVARLRHRVESLSDDIERANRRAERTAHLATTAERRRLLRQLGEVLDSVERALAQVCEPGAVRDGILAIRKQFIAFLQAEGVSLFGAPGEALDPRLHEAIGMEQSAEFDAGQIVRVERHGLRLDDGTIARHAEVVVAA